MSPLDDELSDIRYAPREILVRAISRLTQMVVEEHGGDDEYRTTILADLGLMDNEPTAFGEQL